MPVDSKHSSFAAAQKQWRQVRLCVAGEDAVKGCTTEFLPMPNPENTSKANKARYKGYLGRAVFHNVTGRTLEGLTGQVFAVDPVLTVPDDFDYIGTDVDGSGVTVAQQSKLALETLLQTSRAGLLVDYPETIEPASKEQAGADGIRPRVLLYQPEQIINWRTGSRNGLTLLTLVVLKESYEVEGTDDGFTSSCKDRYRVLRLVNNVYQVEIWEVPAGGSSFAKTKTAVPKKGDGSVWDVIPFQFLGAKANDATVEKPVLLDISYLNLGHYRNSADYEDSVYRVGQPQPWASGLTQDWVDNVYKGKLEMGAASIVLLPENGAFGIEQVQPNTLAKEAMTDKEQQMVALGAKVVEGKTVQKTATEAGIDSSNVTSSLATMTRNVSAGYTQALQWAADFANVTYNEDEEDKDGIALDLNADFAISRMAPDERRQLMSEWQSGGLTDEEYRWNLEKSGVAYEDFDKWKEAKEESDARLLGMGAPAIPGQPGKPGQPLPGKTQPGKPQPPEPKAPAVA